MTIISWGRVCGDVGQRELNLILMELLCTVTIHRESSNTEIETRAAYKGPKFLCISQRPCMNDDDFLQRLGLFRMIQKGMFKQI